MYTLSEWVSICDYAIELVKYIADNAAHVCDIYLKAIVLSVNSS